MFEIIIYDIIYTGAYITKTQTEGVFHANTHNAVLPARVSCYLPASYIYVHGSLCRLLITIRSEVFIDI